MRSDPPPSVGPIGLVKADFVTGIVLFALGGATLVESLRMPRFEELNVNPDTAPGLVPGVLGLVLLMLGAVLFLRAARAGGWRLGTRSAVAHSADPGVHRLALCVALCLGYAAGLVGRLPFWLATFLFVAAFVALFEWPLAISGGGSHAPPDLRRPLCRRGLGRGHAGLPTNLPGPSAMRAQRWPERMGRG